MKTVQAGPWTLTRGSSITFGGRRNDTATQVRAPFSNPKGFRFRFFRKTFLSRLEDRLGMQDVQVDIPDFDEAFVLRGNDEDMIRRLLDSPRVRMLMKEQPSLMLEVRPCPDRTGIDELVFECPGTVLSPGHWKALELLFSAVLDRLQEMGIATQPSPS